MDGTSKITTEIIYFIRILGEKYTHALASYMFNRYLPFGGSSCTSIAQRQSDAIRAAAKLAGVKALTVAVLDDFFIVRPRKHTDTDQDALDRGRHEGEIFDKVLRELDYPRRFLKISQLRLQLIGVEYNS